MRRRELNTFADPSPEEYQGRAAGQPKRKKSSGNLFLKLLVVSCLLSIYAYVGIAFYCFFRFQAVPDSLNYTFLPAIFGQLAAMATITRKEKDVEIAEMKYTCECKQAEVQLQQLKQSQPEDLVEKGGMRG